MTLLTLVLKNSKLSENRVQKVIRPDMYLPGENDCAQEDGTVLQACVVWYHAGLSKVRNTVLIAEGA